MQNSDKSTSIWTIILAGGEGRRLRPMISRWLGRAKPKQYCAFVGTRSMFQHTLDRSDQITFPEQKVIVVGRTHFRAATAQIGDRNPGKLILQPKNRGTAAGIFLAITYIKETAPDATVLLLPSDHFIFPEEKFIDRMKKTVLAAQGMRDHLILLGIRPDRPESDYGYIFPGISLSRVDGRRICAVDDFLEKPDLKESMAALSSGALWNTFILASRVDTLWELGCQYFPSMISLFQQYAKSIGTKDEKAGLEKIYRAMPTMDFSRGLLQKSRHQTAVMELDEFLWCDWGRPKRIVETLRQIGKKPAFSSALATTTN
jgi:mannose-1-phosphate guanylyltransferase